jgi:hypothetical protein
MHRWITKVPFKILLPLLAGTFITIAVMIFIFSQKQEPAEKEAASGTLQVADSLAVTDSAHSGYSQGHFSSTRHCRFQRSARAKMRLLVQEYFFLDKGTLSIG